MAFDMKQKEQSALGSDWLDGIQLAPLSPGFLQSSGFEDSLRYDADDDLDSFRLDQVHSSASRLTPSPDQPPQPQTDVQPEPLWLATLLAERSAKAASIRAHLYLLFCQI